MIELIAVPSNEGNDFVYFKKCCGNCSHSKHLGNDKNVFKCTCQERQCAVFYNNIRILSQNICKYFDFKPVYEYTPDHRLHNTDSSNIHITYAYNHKYDKDEKIKINDNNSALLEAAKLIKYHCKNNHCRNCVFFDKGKCKLETKRNFNFNTVPGDWDV